ncbi:MAG: hypothetical protein AAGI03_00100 [Pseudomonadota bacterium]
MMIESFQFLCAGACLLFATSCASTPPENASETSATTVGEAANDAAEQTRDGLTDAALSPLEDLNLRREPIPNQLKLLTRPYYDASRMSCRQIRDAVLALNADLGRDWDTPNPEGSEDESRLDWAADQSADTALGAVSSQARSFIPLRGLVREASGANSYENRVRTAYRIGTERRAFLKGIGLAKGCQPPAAPWPETEDNRRIIYRGTGPSE